MTSESNIPRVREWVEIGWNQGDMERLPEFFPSTFMNEEEPATVDTLIQWSERQRATFPNMHYVIDDIFAVNDRVALRWTATATQTGALWGFIPPTNKRVSWSGMHMLRLSDQRIIEIWATSGLVAMLQQIGITLHPPV